MTTAPMPQNPQGPRPDRPGYDPRGYDPHGYGPSGDQQPGYGPGYDRPDYDPGYGLPRYDRARPGRPPSGRPSVAAGQLWGGGVATAIVAALVALVGVLVTRWLAGIPLLAPMRDGAYGDVHTTSLVLLVAAAALVATGLLHLLLLSTPRPTLFFGWIIALATVLAVVVPFTTSAPLDQKAATAAVFLVIGVAIGTLLISVGARSIRVRGSGGPYGADPAYRDRNSPSQFS